MNTLLSVRSPLCALTALLSFGLGFDAFGQSVTTTPVGAMTYTFPANNAVSVGIPLLRPSVFSGVVSSGDAASVTFSVNGLNFASLLTSGSVYYLEVAGHSDGVTNINVGERFEINESTTILNANGVLSVDTSSSLNTANGPFSSLVGYKVVIRPHWTLASLFGTGTGVVGLTSATSFPAADQILAWNGTIWTTYWFRQNSAGTVKEWRNVSTGVTNQNAAIIPSGVGVYFRKQGQSNTITVVGEVRTNRFIRNLDNTTQLIALGHPVDVSPNQLGFLPNANFTAAMSFNVADQILTWNGSIFSTYWLRRNSAGDVIQWRNTATGATDYTNNKFIASDQAFFIRPVGSPNDLVQATPFNL